MSDVYDIAIVGGGINGCGIARDAAGRGLKVLLLEQGDLGAATSSASTKLFHGGLRYLEHYEFRLVREALKERELLLQAMPHISWPLRFVLPHHKDLRPAWLLRLGLFFYDHLGGRKLLPGTKTLNLNTAAQGKPLKRLFSRGFQYSDCWVQDSRLVVLNARDAEQRGATILPRHRCVSAVNRAAIWELQAENTVSGETRSYQAKVLINAAGPWVKDFLNGVARLNTASSVRLVRGSHIVVKKLYDHDDAYIFQNGDGRIIFAIPYEGDFTLIGTTDADHEGTPDAVACSDEEASYLCEMASNYFATPVKVEDIVWRYSGVRPLYDNGTESASAATRDYVLELEEGGGRAPLLNIFGGKITTYRRLAEAALQKLSGVVPNKGKEWTAGVALPGGDFPIDGMGKLEKRFAAEFPFLVSSTRKRLLRDYGTEAWLVLEGVTSLEGFGRHFGAGIFMKEVEWLILHEYVHTAEDIVWRRNRQGLKMTNDEISALDMAVKQMRRQMSSDQERQADKQTEQA